MNGFRVGDVCVIVKATKEYVGLECVVISLKSKSPDMLSVEVPAKPSGSHLGYAVFPFQIRRKRPPSWDQWLFDTSGVRDERPTGNRLLTPDEAFKL